ncbi:MAG: ABC transporter permease [Thermoanaerobaculaceae bacterium]|jgi:predicted permease|nr:ABC transporter permease [Thermoanaerobaculaceae bacterium]
MGSLRQDLTYATRLLVRDRGFSITAILTLALVIGANVAIFSVINSVLLQPLPFERAGDLLEVFNSYPNAGVDRASTSAPDFFDRRKGVAAFEEVASYRERDLTLGTRETPRRVHAMQVTPSFFPLLRATPRLGRGFTETEGEVGNDRRVILSHALWAEAYGRDSGVAGREVSIDGVPHLVVGVMPADFFFRDPRVQLWIPQAFTDEDREAYHSNNWSMLARLAPGATVGQAQAQVDALNARQLERSPELKGILVNAGYCTRVVSLQEDLVRDIRQTFYLLWAGVVFVLLIGCVNVANLALVRATVRLRELSMRVALGAGRGRVARQLITESLLLTAVSAVVGLGLGWAGIRAFGLLGMDRLPRGTEVGIDGTVLLATLGAALVIGVALGLIPLLHGMRANTSSVLREEGRSSTVGRRAQLVRRGLVAVQVATAFMLLIGAGLLFASFRHVVAIDPGFEPDGVLTAAVTLPDARYPKGDDRRGFARRALEAIRAVPGVEAASVTGTIPFGGDYSDSVILVEGYEMKPGESLVSPSRMEVAAGYFETLGIPLVAGRLFDGRDVADAARTVIVDERLAKRFWPGQSPVGKRMYYPSNVKDPLGTDASTVWLTVVGVVGDTRLQSLADTDERIGTTYFPFEQAPRRFVGFTIRTSGEPTHLVETVRRTLAGMDPELPVFDTVTLSGRISDSLVARRSPMLLTLVFAGVALFLAGVGLYGVLAYLVSGRTREIGIRMALGSTPREVFRLVMREGLGILGLGLAAGLALAVLLRRALAGHLHGVGPLDPLVLATVAVVLTAVALAACSVPALRATRVHPAIALRDR